MSKKHYSPKNYFGFPVDTFLLGKTEYKFVIEFENIPKNLSEFVIKAGINENAPTVFTINLEQYSNSIKNSITTNFFELNGIDKNIIIVNKYNYNGLEYRGSLKNGKPNGYGELSNPSPSGYFYSKVPAIFQGNWVNGKKEGDFLVLYYFTLSQQLQKAWFNEYYINDEVYVEPTKSSSSSNSSSNCEIEISETNSTEQWIEVKLKSPYNKTSVFKYKYEDDIYKIYNDAGNMGFYYPEKSEVTFEQVIVDEDLGSANSISEAVIKIAKRAFCR